MNRVIQIVGGIVLCLALTAGLRASARAGQTTAEAAAVQSSVDQDFLPAPAGVRAVAQVKGVTLRWREVSGCDGYRIYWSAQESLRRPQAQVSEVAAGSGSCKVDFLMPGVQYAFRVCALSSCKEGRLSRQVAATPLSATGTSGTTSVLAESASENDWIDRSQATQTLSERALPPPKNIRITPLVAGALLRWSPVKGSAGYRVYWGREGLVSRCSSGTADVPPDLVNCRFRHLVPGAAYRFRVCTLTATREGPLSRQVGVKPKAGTATRPSDAAP